MTARYAIMFSSVALTVCAVVTTPADAQTIAIKNATVYTEPGKMIAKATVTIANGKLRAVGKNVAIPRNARVIDGTDKIVTAGFIAASSRIGLVEVSLESSTREGTFGGPRTGKDAIRAAFQVTDGYNAMSVAIPVARKQGVTAAVTAPVGGLISGASACYSLADGIATDVLVAGPVAMYASLGESALGNADGSRGMALLRLREAFDDAELYNRLKRSYERNQTREFAASRLDLAALQPVLARRIPLVLRANRSSDILAGIRLGKELGIRVIIEGGVEAWLVAKQLADANVGVIMDSSMNLPYSFDRVNVRDDTAKLLADAGVDIAISPLNSAHGVGIVRQLAGIAVANGMKPEHALAAVTTTPAKLFGIDRGTLRAGAVADLVVWSGDPFELSTRAEHVIINGEVQALRNRQDLLFERYRELPKK